MKCYNLNGLDLLHYEDVQRNFRGAECGMRLLTYLRLSWCTQLFASTVRLFPLALTASTYSITKWWCWYFDDQFMSGWAGPCVWTHFHRFLLKTVQSFQSDRGVGVPRLWAEKTKTKNKKKNRGSTQRLDRGERDGEGNVSKSFFVRAHLAPPPPQG